MLSEQYFRQRGVRFTRTWGGITASGPAELEADLRTAVVERMPLVQQMPSPRDEGCDGCGLSLPAVGQRGMCVLCSRAREKVLQMRKYRCHFCQRDVDADCDGSCGSVDESLDRCPRCGVSEADRADGGELFMEPIDG